MSTEISLIYLGSAAFLFFLVGIIILLTGLKKQEKKSLQSWSMSLITAGIAVMFFLTCFSMYEGYITLAKVIVFLSGISYLTVAFLFKKEIFLYLITFNIAVLFFNFLQTAGDKFTQHLFSYFIYAIIFIGFFFTIPYLKKLIRNKRMLVMFTITNWKGMLLLSIPVAAILLIITVFYSVEITEHPKFCGACHFMDEYIESWEHSGHSGVRCVDCHYEPGVKAIAVGKIDGLMQMAKYMTHSYTSKPAAEISDKSCLRSGCHAEMDKEAPLSFAKGMKYKHSDHLDHKVKGRKLRCSTCHSQNVAGNHLSINKSACFLCHFYKEDKVTSDCNLCHDTKTGVLAETHRDYFAELGDNIDCTECHMDIVRGDGKIIRNNCLFCHNNKDERLQHSSEEIHEQHVTEHKVECIQCHHEIEHGY